MTETGGRRRTRARQQLVGLLILVLLQFGCASTPADGPDSATENGAASTADGTTDGAHSTHGSGRLEPRYQPREPVPEPWYNSDYIFGMTRGVANSTMAPAGKAPLFVLTLPLDLATLPFTLIGGFF